MDIKVEQFCSYRCKIKEDFDRSTLKPDSIKD